MNAEIEYNWVKSRETLHLFKVKKLNPPHFLYGDSEWSSIPVNISAKLIAPHILQVYIGIRTDNRGYTVQVNVFDPALEMGGRIACPTVFHGRVWYGKHFDGTLQQHIDSSKPDTIAPSNATALLRLPAILAEISKAVYTKDHE